MVDFDIANRVDSEEQWEWCMRLEGFIDGSALFASGVYALLHKGEVVYIGQSNEVLRRICEHRNAHSRWMKKEPGWSKMKAIPFDNLWFKPVHPSDLNRVEREMVAKYMPKYNDKLKPRPVQSISGLVVNGVILGMAKAEPPTDFIRRV